MNQYAAFHGNKGDREARVYEGSKRAQVTSERPRRGARQHMGNSLTRQLRYHR